MLTPIFCMIAAVLVHVALYLIVTAGLRNGDRPGDAQVTAGSARGTVLVRNPSGTPVLAALTARRPLLPAWLIPPHDVSVARWTQRGKFDPERYECVGVVPEGGETEFAVPVPVGRPRRVLVMVVIGQQGGRLRVHRLRLTLSWRTAEGKGELFASAPLR